jgi:hypothetical protein
LYISRLQNLKEIHFIFRGAQSQREKLRALPGGTAGRRREILQGDLNSGKNRKISKKSQPHGQPLPQCRRTFMSLAEYFEYAPIGRMIDDDNRRRSKSSPFEKQIAAPRFERRQPRLGESKQQHRDSSALKLYCERKHDEPQETRAYFFGRDVEISELHLRLRSNPLPMLYGRSGLGKTSILLAGLIPRLQAEGRRPLLLRLSYGKSAQHVCDQLVSAVFGWGDSQSRPISLKAKPTKSLVWMQRLGEKLGLSLPRRPRQLSVASIALPQRAARYH